MINQKALAGAMKRMGIQQIELDAEEVVIRLKDHDLVFTSPNVSKINMMGQETYQLIGTPQKRIREIVPEVTHEDVKTVMEQAHVDEAKARDALQKAKGDIAQAIISLT